MLLRFFRLSRIIYSLGRHGLFSWLPVSSKVKKPFIWEVSRKIGRYICPVLPSEKRDLLGVITKLGPFYIKIGQFLAARPDILPSPLCDLLGRLQDDVTPFPDEQAYKLLRTTIDLPEDASISPVIAAASIAQLHKVVLPDGRVIAVKILRPGIEKVFADNLRFWQPFAKIMDYMWPRLRFVQVLQVFEDWMQQELDLCMEAAALAEFSQYWKNEDKFKVPTVYWQYCSHNVLAMSFIDGIAFSQQSEILTSGQDLKLLATQIMQNFLYYATHHGVFHGDYHPGNLFLCSEGRIAFVDLGIIGRLDQETQGYLAQILYGFVTRDYEKVADIHIQAGYVPSHCDRMRFAQALRVVGEPIFNKTATQISMGQMLGQLFQVTKMFDMVTQPQLLLLQKNMIAVEGLVRRLDPEFNLWEVARPVLHAWMKQYYHPAARMKRQLAMLQDMVTLSKRAIHLSTQPQFQRVQNRNNGIFYMMAIGIWAIAIGIWLL